MRELIVSNIKSLDAQISVPNDKVTVLELDPAVHLVEGGSLFQV